MLRDGEPAVGNGGFSIGAGTVPEAGFAARRPRAIITGAAAVNHQRVDRGPRVLALMLIGHY
jgi:hypothetical protein